MGVSEQDLRIVKLTKFKKMSSVNDLSKSSDSIEDTVPDEASGTTAPSNIDPAENAAPTTPTKNTICICSQGSLARAECLRCLALAESPRKGRTRRKSWCVESSLKKQFNRDSAARRTLERSECLPPVLESQSYSTAFVSSPARLAGMIDQRLRRLRLAGKAMTLAIPSERRRHRPSIFDSSRRKSEAGITLAGLKARRKSEGLLMFEGIKAFPDRLKTSSLRASMNSSKEQKLSREISTVSINKCENVSPNTSSEISSPSLTLKCPASATVSRKDFNNLNSSLRTRSMDERDSDGRLVQEILSFNSRNILESNISKSISVARKISPPIATFVDELQTKNESDKSLSLLQDEEHLERCSSEASEEAQELTKDVRRHITSFADRLHLTKDRLEDTAKCYLLLDKAYEWALEAMKVVGRVKSSGTATPEQVGTAAEAIGELLHENPPVSEETFDAMIDLATKLDNQTLLQQCKMAHARCKETFSLLRSRQSALLKARRQMEFDCQSFVDLNEILSVPDDQCSISSAGWFQGTPFTNSGRRRSGCSQGSRPRDPLSRCSSVETDDDSVFSESPFSSTPAKAQLEAKSSLGGIKELKESSEDLLTNGFSRSSSNYFRSSVGSDFRFASNELSPSPSTINNIAGSTDRAFSSGSSSSCSSSDSSGPTSGSETKKGRRSRWQFSESNTRTTEESNDCLDESLLPLSPISSRSSLPLSYGPNSHLLIRGSQINLSNSEDLTQEEVRKNKTLLLIMQELIQTERDYVCSLEYIIENYVPELLRDDIPQALRGQRNVVFGNIEKIHEFHSGYFLKALESCQSRPFAVGSIFLRYESQFYLYALYNKNKPKSDELMADFGASFFKTMQMSLGDKMDLSSYLLKPVQRMGKYALLLKQLLKECGRNEEGHEELKAAEEMVQFQLRHGNDLLAMDSLRECDVNLKEQGRLLRQGEFLVTEGSRGKKSLRHVFLFEELILFSKARKDPDKRNLDIFQYKQSLKTTDIGLTAQLGETPDRFEIWFRKRKPSDTFIFQSPSSGVKEAWTEEISKLLWRQALRNRKLRQHEMSSMGIGNKPCLDIRPSEDQINDRSVCIAKAPPRLRLTTSASLTDASQLVRRPHSVISVSSSSSSADSSSQSSSAGPSYIGTLNLGFESGDSPKPLQRSVTRTSQCSAESGIITDIFPERETEESHSKVERSNSTVTNSSVDSALSPCSTLSQQSSLLSPLEEPLQLLDELSSPKEIATENTMSNKTKTLLTSEV